MDNKEDITIENGIDIAKKVLEIAARSKNVYSKYYSDTFHVNGTPRRFMIERYFLDPQSNIEKIIDLSKYYYNKVGLIMRTINIERDFGADGYAPIYPTANKRVRKLIKEYEEKINIKQVIKDMIFELALTGNLVCYDRGGWIDFYAIGKQVEVSDLIRNGKNIVLFDITSDVPLLSFDDEKISRELTEAYPYEVLKGRYDRKRTVELNTSNTYFTKLNGSRYEKYGIPPLLPALDDLAHKNLMTEAERSTALSVINKILLFQVGSKEHPTTDKEVEYYANALSTKDGSIEVTVPWFVDGKFIEPSTEVFAASATVQSNIEDSLLGTLGISLSLIKGEGGGSYAENQVNLSGLIKTINNIRELIIPIINDMYKKVLIANRIPLENCPKAHFEDALISEDVKRQIYEWLFTNAGLSYEQLYESHGVDFEEAKSFREQENSDKLEDTFKLREQAFQGNGGVKSGTDDTNVNGSPAGGRPKSNNSKTTNNDTPRPSKK